MKSLLLFLLTLSVTLFVIFMVPTIILALSIGLGWLVTQVLPLSLFEGSLLSVIAIGISLFILERLLTPSRRDNDDNDDDDDNEDFDNLFHEWLENEFEIPQTRFYKTETEKTWEAWIRFEIANSIYQELGDAPYSIVRMGEKGLQELAIRLAEIGVNVIREKSPRSKSVKVTVAALRRWMTKKNQRPYDDDILKISVKAINDELDYEETLEIIQSQLWDEPCELFD